ncbi:hypothetical protein AB0B50_04260 [Streptomyces sp. NPDC041068]|uniref:hypothetical protein n=1 Tax=Streptomyces sp. NPDC041068 TaxID=3155130 RepID=UPI0033ECCACD
MIDEERIKALANLPSPRRAGPGIDAAGIVRTLSGLHGEAALIAQPVQWSNGLCAQHPLKTGDAHTPVAPDLAERVCRVCPIRSACQAAVSAGVPAQVRRWRNWADDMDGSAEQ